LTVIDRLSFPLKHRCDLPRAVEGPGGVNLINPVLERHFLRTRTDRTIVEARPAYPQQLRLDAQRQFALFSFDQSDPFISPQRDGQLFFHPRDLSLKPPDLLVEGFFLLLVNHLSIRRFLAFLFEHGGKTLEGRRFPLTDLNRMDPAFSG
jgi:hypothetical protein